MVAPAGGVTSPLRVEHPSREQRVARGKTARAAVPRRWQAELRLEGRPAPLALLEEQDRDRIPELVPVRYGRMIESPFSFYRGAAVVMASDLSRTASSGLYAQLCGDAHLANFGMFGTPERNHVFDTTDFDETLPGPWEWDVKRLTTSFEIAGRAKGVAADDRRAILLAVVGSYRTGMLEFAARKNLEVWYARLDIDAETPELSPRQVKKKRKVAAKALTRDSEHAYERLTLSVGAQRRIVSHPPIVVPMGELYGDGRDRAEFERAVHHMYRQYRASLPNDRRALLERFRMVDIARKVSASGAWARAAGSRYSKASIGTTRSSCRSNKPNPPSSSASSGAADMPTAASASSRGSA
jgi:hypothetical protein